MHGDEIGYFFAWVTLSSHKVGIVRTSVTMLHCHTMCYNASVFCIIQLCKGNVELYYNAIKNAHICGSNLPRLVEWSVSMQSNLWNGAINAG
jgi:hypothetical protein